VDDVDILMVTHFHVDHTADISTFLSHAIMASYRESNPDRHRWTGDAQVLPGSSGHIPVARAEVLPA